MSDTTVLVELTQEILTRLEREADRRGKSPSDVVMGALNLCLPAADYVESIQETNYDALTKLLRENQMDTGIPDLAHQHDHYLYGTPKREPYPPETGA